ncbi:hypothetical protein [Arthrobacter sp. 260]|uniref:hypothetical protein n=1 Tax=Arthrobacter sp. 260 TaxID=2735314 RepID=UPI001491B3B1|nr:hypothetical protein [Arthrobacter sp. 260]NOJ60957.1 hypothetical protein [Arthrobacter sp. 260]
MKSPSFGRFVYTGLLVIVVGLGAALMRKLYGRRITMPPNKPNKVRVRIQYLSFGAYVAGFAAFIPSGLSQFFVHVCGKEGEALVSETIGEEVPYTIIGLYFALAILGCIGFWLAADQKIRKEDLGVVGTVSLLLLFLPSIIIYVPPIPAIGISAAAAGALYLHAFLNNGKTFTPTKEVSPSGDSV